MIAVHGAPFGDAQGKAQIDYIKTLANKINEAIEAEGEKRLTHILGALVRAMLREVDAERRRAQMQLVSKPADGADADS